MKKRWGWLIALAAIWGLGGGSIVSQASDTAVSDDLPASFALNGIFNTTSKIPNVTNNATLVTNNHGLQLTSGATSQNGAAWATSDNKFDLSKNGRFSMWLYFGKNGASNSGQGMAFVMQNAGATGFTAFPSAAKPAGQSLGVWGVDYDNTATDAKAVAASAIQKSWALEFDEQVNNNRDGGNNSGLDYNYPYEDEQHVASNYPGETTSYARNGTQSSGNKYYYRLIHQGAFVTTLSDGAWHHVTLDWTAPTGTSDTGTMTYTLGDKNPTTGASQTPTNTKTVSVDLTKLGINATDSTKQVYWGFTGTSTTLTANNVVAFEHIPGLVNASSAVTVTDQSTGKTISDGDTVNGNDALAYTYKLNYDGGNQTWQNIEAQLPRPAGVTFSAGTITYADGSTETLSSSELNSSTLAHTLGKNLSTANASATITLTGQANAVTSQTSVASTIGHFNGSNEISSVTTPSYTIFPARQWILAVSSGSTMTAQPGQSVKVTGSVAVDSSADDETVTNKDVTMHASLDNGYTIDDFTLNGSSSDPDEEGVFNLTIPADKLVTGVNKLTLYTTDDRGNKSKEVSVTITVTGTLAFKNVNPKSSFVTTRLAGTSTLIGRNADWDVSVTNARGKGSEWSVTAQASDFTDPDTATKLAGEAVWVDASGNTSSLTQAQVIASGTNTAASQTTNIVDDWGNAGGIMLKTNSDAISGDYQGTITWTLSNTLN
ncbi:L-type lectin family protein [Levilactobacillus angrenensis]|uniref:WxL domain-containing protein n=1 Tax=Levilactobacillus angrenensis TaxID=2486020 RepID=A0ABW1UCK7_9LACO|nr:hypothetical protein [Levilactobacillus angrenensis]